MAYQSRDTTWKEMVYDPDSFNVKSLSTKLKEMGFQEKRLILSIFDISQSPITV